MVQIIITFTSSLPSISSRELEPWDQLPGCPTQGDVGPAQESGTGCHCSEDAALPPALLTAPCHAPRGKKCLCSRPVTQHIHDSTAPRARAHWWPSKHKECGRQNNVSPKITSPGTSKCHHSRFNSFPKRYIQVLIPDTCKCDLIWK